MGLKNYSNTSMMTTGAAYGAGSNPTNILHLTNLKESTWLLIQELLSAMHVKARYKFVSVLYLTPQQGWDKSIFSKSSANYMQCLCLCEVINAGYKANPYYVVPNEGKVLLTVNCIITSM
jgi:hypothetical protein